MVPLKVTVMRTYWSDPYLWIHLAGLATLPVWLELCVLGLAAGDPVLPIWLELGLLALVGIVPILWMQLQRPFYIFSIVLIALKPGQLTDDERRLLTQFRSLRNQVLALGGAGIMVLVLLRLYDWAAIAAPASAQILHSHWTGLGIAAASFLAANLFLQVPISVLGVLVPGNAAFAATPPYPIDQIRFGFTRIGIPVNQIVPRTTVAAASAAVPAAQVILETTPDAQPEQQAVSNPETDTAATESTSMMGAEPTPTPVAEPPTVPHEPDEANVSTHEIQPSPDETTAAATPINPAEGEAQPGETLPSDSGMETPPSDPEDPQPSS